jgi:glyceraldehyde 3-phosphate dehydrogenase
MINIGINGFGRIGRLVLRIALKRDNIRVVAINNPSTDSKYMSYLYKYDTTHGKSYDDIKYNDDKLIINGNSIDIYREKDPSKIPWINSGASHIIDASGQFTTFEKASLHHQGGAKKILITSPSIDTPMFVLGVNEDKYLSSMNIISNASCTTNCAGPILKILNEHFGIDNCFITTIHATTASQKTVDGTSVKDWRAGRSILNNIIPSSSGAISSIGKIIPELDGKISGLSYRVPIGDVSVVDLSINLKNKTSLDLIKETIKNYSNKRYIGYIEEPTVSSDFIGDPRSCIIDMNNVMMISDNFLKLTAWYDNEWGYSNRVVDLVQIFV